MSKIENKINGLSADHITIFSQHTKILSADHAHGQLLLPDGLFLDDHMLRPFQSQTFRIERCLKTTQQSPQIPIDKVNGCVLYAPSYLALWAVKMAVLQPNIVSHCILDAQPQGWQLALYLTKLRLYNERRLMGSDVPSPIIKKALRQHVSVADYFALNIGEWLSVFPHYSQNIQSLEARIFWLKKTTTQNEIQGFLTKACQKVDV